MNCKNCNFFNQIKNFNLLNHNFFSSFTIFRISGNKLIKMCLRKFSFCTVLFSILFAKVTGQITEDFEDGFKLEWSQYPGARWQLLPDTALEGNFCLHHAYDNSSSDADVIFTKLTDLQPDSGLMHISFKLKYGYSPSGTNNWAVFLYSDGDGTKMYPASQATAYIIGVNFAGNDDTLRFWKNVNGQVIPVYNTGVNWQENISTGTTIQFNIIRRPPGQWEVIVGTLNDTLSTGSFNDNTSSLPGYFGVYYSYTSTKDRLLWFDDLQIDGTFIKDTLHPLITSVECLSARQLEIGFNEPVDLNETNWQNYFAFPGGLEPYAIYFTPYHSVILPFAVNFPCNDSVFFVINDLPDLSGNKLSHEMGFYYSCPIPYDVIITEIMSEPEPSAGLPGYEYIELYNTTSKDINLNGWSVQTGSVMKKVESIHIPANEYLILCHNEAVSEFSEDELAKGIFTNKNSLNDMEDFIILRSADGVIINRLNYHPGFHGNPEKMDGGYSMELMCLQNPCGHPGDWCSSLSSKGGTPGKANSKDSYCNNFPVPIEASVIDSFTLEITFNGPADSINISNFSSYTINPAVGYPKETLTTFPFEKVTFRFSGNFKSGMDYTLKIYPLPANCMGESGSGSYSFSLALPETPESVDIQFSEILFNPVPGCVDFIEVYNNSGKYLDLSSIFLGTRDKFTSKIKQFIGVHSGHRLISPASYNVFYPSDELFDFCYQPCTEGSLVPLSSFPSLPDDEGILLLMDRDTNILDEVYYNKNMHHALIKDPEGISLEKICMDGSGSEIENWHSASENAGYSSPGCTNSQSRDCQNELKDKVVIDPEIFSPDNDGFDDFLMVRIQEAREESVANIYIFNEKGQMVRHLVNNGLCGFDNLWQWDGLDDNGILCFPGPYIVYAEVFTLDGRTEKNKKICVLTLANRR